MAAFSPHLQACPRWAPLVQVPPLCVLLLLSQAPLTVTTPSRSAQGPGSAMVRDFHELRHWEITVSSLFLQKHLEPGGEERVRQQSVF